ncbi:MAG TPA: AI-2E family transporter [Phycisphaerales bacterium]|nr:AI-2E family transporter [Phycisphaerales bacterium]
MAETPFDPPAPTLPKPSRTDWKSLHLWQIQWVRDVLVVLGVIGLFWLGQRISVVTVPLLLAILLAYLFEPVIRWCMRGTGWTRQGTVAAVLIAAILIIVIPAAVGLTFGVAQSIFLLKDVTPRIEVTYKAVEVGGQLKNAQARVAEIQRVVSASPSAEIDEVVPAEPPPDEAAPPGGPPPAEPSGPDGREKGAREGAGGTPSDESAAEVDELDLTAAREEVARLAAEYKARLTEVEALAGDRYRDIAVFIQKWAGGSVNAAFGAIDQWLRANAEGIAAAGADAVRTTAKFLGGLFGLLFMAFVTAFFFYFIATGWVELQRFGGRTLPERHRAQILDLLVKFDRVISAFIRGRLTIAFIQSVVFTIGYFIIGVPAAFILGPVVAVLSIVPYLALVGLPVSIALLALADHDGLRGQWWWIVGAPTAFYFIAQALDDYVWTPLIQGKSTDMSTPMILFASLAGGVLFGVFGLLIAIPIAACLKILIQEIFWPRFKAWGEGRENDFLPIGRE